MAHPLENYRSIAKENYINTVERKFYTQYVSELETGLIVSIEKKNSRLLVSGHDLYKNESFNDSISFSSYFIDEYNKLENEVRSRLDETIHLDERKQESFVKRIVAELQVLKDAIEKNSLKPQFDPYKAILIDKVANLITILKQIHLTPRNSTGAKIKWLGTNKQLGTLFFDLWKGQKGTSKNSKGFKPIIEVESKEQLMKFIFHNFENRKGEQLSLSSLSDQLNEAESKNEQRANDNRIELSC